MQEILTDRARRFHFQAVDRGQCIHATIFTISSALPLPAEWLCKSLAAAHPLSPIHSHQPFSQDCSTYGNSWLSHVDRGIMALGCQR